MFQVSLEQMDHRRMELLEFEHKLNRLRVRLEEQARVIEIMESFSEIWSWLIRTVEQMEEQTGQVKELGIALESIIRIYRGSEERIQEHMEDGAVEKADPLLIPTVTTVPGDWPEILKF